ncbi:MAG: hypothetical protein EB060_12450 [Proteobacteria bacterium]|nr:hypothetical protein [Pseudomonadota bacterium]
MSTRNYIVSVTPKLPEAEVASVVASSVEQKDRTHSPDWLTVHWDGRTYHFTGPVQRGIVAALWLAWESGCPDVLDSALLEEACSDGSRVQDVLKRHPALGTLIVRSSTRGGPAGAWRLAV